MINILGVTKDIKACPRCGCYTMEYREMGIHIGKYCKNCNKWIKWVAHKEVPEELAARILQIMQLLSKTYGMLQTKMRRMHHGFNSTIR